MEDADEQAIISYLKFYRGEYISGSEICRKAANRKRFNKDPRWAFPALERLVVQKVLESDSTGHYRLVPPAKRKVPSRHLSPQVRAILERSERKFDSVLEIPEEPGEPGA